MFGYFRTIRRTNYPIERLSQLVLCRFLLFFATFAAICSWYEEKEVHYSDISLWSSGIRYN